MASITSQTDTRLTLHQLITGDFAIGIVGIGVENRRFLSWLIDTIGIDTSRIILADRNTPTDLPYALTDFGQTFFGDHYLDICKQYETIQHIFKAPGIWSLKPEFEEFRHHNGENSIHSPLTFFFQAFRSQIIGITGTKGKSTTSALIKYLLEQPDYIAEYTRIHNTPPSAIYTGNTTNTSPYDYWTDIHTPHNPHHYFVIELSSFQLQDLAYDQLSPARSVITNYYIDHQDQHATHQEYWHAKNTLHLYQQPSDYSVLNAQIKDRAEVDNFKQQVLWIDDTIADTLIDSVATTIIGHHNRVNMSLALSIAMTALQPTINQSTIIENGKKLLDQYPQLFKNFIGLRHRLEVVGTYTSVINLTFTSFSNNNSHDESDTSRSIPLTIIGVNDSYSTMPEAAYAGIKALTEKDTDSIWLIISGKDKGGSVDQLCTGILDIQAQHKLFRLDYYGQIGLRVINNLYAITGSSSHIDSAHISSLKETLPDDIAHMELVVKHYQTWLQEIVNQCIETGDTEYVKTLQSLDSLTLYIVLSPCGSSFDEFTNATQRGDWFTETIRTAFTPTQSNHK